MPISNYGRDQMLDWVWNADATGIPTGDLYMQLHSGDPNATGASNVVSVARVQVPVGAAASGTVANTGNVDFVSMPAVTGDGVWGWSVHDGAGSGLPPTGANAWWWGVFNSAEGVADAGTAEVTSNLFHSGAHGLTTNDRVCFLAVPGAPGGSIGGPTLIGTGTGVLYHVIATGLTTDVFSVSTTQGGGALDLTGDGTLRWFKVGNKTTNLNDTFRVATGDLDVFLEA
jgi:hypothetical protein